MSKQFNRRNFLKKGAQAGLGIALSSIMLKNYANSPLKGVPEFKIAKPLKKVRIGFVGVGGMGRAHVTNYLKIEGAEIVAVCDLLESRTARVQKLCEQAGKPVPVAYYNGELDFKNLCARQDLDLVFTATPWEWHVPVCLEAMNNGKHAATEVPAALSVKDCWKLVETAELTGKYCMMMENCNYDQAEMTILNMVKQGMFGELLHANCGYLHDLRAVKHDMNGEGVWRRAHSMTRNGDLYPTHGLGPVAQCMNINRGNQFDYLVSMGTKTRGLHQYAVREFGADSPQAKEEFVLGDVVTTMIRTMNGETITLTHDTNSPRPYSRDIMVQGTKGLVRKYPDSKIYLEGISPTPHSWEDFEPYNEKYKHPVWKNLEEASKGAGHGGMDFIEDYRLINALLKGIEPDMDVYDAAAISVITELSEQSINNNGAPVKFPDFTRGKWQTARPLMVDIEV